MRKSHKKNKAIKIPKARINVFLTLITTVIAISFSISKFVTAKASQSSGQVAKWDIELNTDYNSYVLFENGKANSKDFTITVKSESEVSSKYDLEVDGLYKQYNAVIQQNEYKVGYSFNNNNLNIQYGDDEMTFDITNSEQSVEVNGKSYRMEKQTSIGKTQLMITNENANKEIVELSINNDNEIKIIYKNCKEYIDSGKHEDIYNFNINTSSTELPKVCNIMIYSLFEQLD